MNDRPRVSFVATSRNDDHGGDLLGRMQRFVDGIDAQCRRHGLDAELVLVEWNPPADSPELARVLRWPPSGGPLAVTIVTVPHAVHCSFDNSERLPLYQMIAKNVGIRRARGEFVAATNIDILFSDEIFRSLKDQLVPKRLYRADRHDVEPHPPAGASMDEILQLCRSNTVRINRRDGTLLVEKRIFLPVYETFREVLLAWFTRLARHALHGTTRAIRAAFIGTVRCVNGLFLALIRFGSGDRKAKKASTKRRSAADEARNWRRSLLSGAALFRTAFLRAPAVPYYAWRRIHQAWMDTHKLPHLHTNGCGDWTLMSAHDWNRLRGYPEWPIFSWHLDSVLVHQAAASGITIVELPRSCAVYHLEHSKGSGFTPDGEALLFGRLSDAKIPYLSSADFSTLAVDLYRRARKGEDLAWHQKDWGLTGQDLSSVTVTHASWEHTTHSQVREAR